MNYGNIKYTDIANGSGIRLTLFVSGCSNHCKGCFQPETWDPGYGAPFTEEVEEKIMKELRQPWYQGVTILGGEPMEFYNQHGLLPFLQRLRRERPELNIWVYTGNVYEDMMPGGIRHCEVTDALLRCIDVLVDGRFDETLKNIRLQFRGSENQRIIDMKKSLAEEKPVLCKQFR
ncbi:MAG: anaerobic ribonucleoside-triphosphate reductase activating protein [Eubacteriales bacterium]|nr:anaerobic ribonucleoside-triphosphate reductase activating protein [Eubacteriales bacterium]